MSDHESIKIKSRPDTIYFPEGYSVKRLKGKNVWYLERSIEVENGNIKKNILYTSSKLYSVLSQIVYLDIHWNEGPFGYAWGLDTIRRWVERVCSDKNKNDFYGSVRAN